MIRVLLAHLLGGALVWGGIYILQKKEGNENTLIINYSDLC